jgi:diguanylate cyclase (GGDEF)-like protein
VQILVNGGDLAEWEATHPVDEVYPIAAFPLMESLAEEARPWVVALDGIGVDAAEAELLHRLGKHSAIGVPIRADGLVWGELFISRDAAQAPFDADDIPLAQAFAGLLSAGLAQVSHRERIEQMALTDPLTGLGNRRLVEAAINTAFATDAGVAVVMADMNRLKQANDTYGHAAGDTAIRAMAAAMSAAAGIVPGAVVGRLGGDEFCAVLPALDDAAAMVIAADVAARTADAPYGVTLALGVAAAAPGADADLSRLLAAADAAQYQAKASGSTQPVLAGPGAARNDRRGWRSRVDAADLLAAGLERAGESGDVVHRLAAVIGGLARDVDALGWVLSGRERGVALPVAGEAHVDGLDLVTPVPAADGAPWLTAADRFGVVIVEEPPLAATRGVARVAVAGADGWLGEVLLPGDGAAEPIATVLRAVMAAATGR